MSNYFTNITAAGGEAIYITIKVSNYDDIKIKEMNLWCRENGISFTSVLVERRIEYRFIKDEDKTYFMLRWC